MRIKMKIVRCFYRFVCNKAEWNRFILKLKRCFDEAVAALDKIVF